MAKVLGVDPGIANTGWAIVETTTDDYSIIDSGIHKTRSGQDMAERIDYILYNVADQILLGDHTIDTVAIESVFFGINASSALSTAYVIGAILATSSRFNIPTMLFTPQQVKMAIGLKGNAKKREVMGAANLLFDKKITNHHTADAVCVAIAGILKMREVEK